MIPERSKRMREMRMATRVRLVVPATYSIHESLKQQIRLSEDVVKTTTRDISTLGVALDSKYLIPKGTLINVGIDSSPFYRGKKGLGKPIRVVGVVGKLAYTLMVAKGRYRLGVEFIEIRKEDKEAIAKFVEEHRRIVI